MIKFKCLKCDSVIKVPESFGGKKGKCRSCGNPVSVPGQSPVFTPDKVESPRKPKSRTKLFWFLWVGIPLMVVLCPLALFTVFVNIMIYIFTYETRQEMKRDAANSALTKPDESSQRQVKPAISSAPEVAQDPKPEPRIEEKPEVDPLPKIAQSEPEPEVDDDLISGRWIESQDTDSSGNPTGRFDALYITDGKFSNTAVTGAEMSVTFGLIEMHDGSVVFLTQLFEYKRDVPATFGSYDDLAIHIEVEGAGGLKLEESIFEGRVTLDGIKMSKSGSAIFLAGNIGKISEIFEAGGTINFLVANLNSPRQYWEFEVSSNNFSSVRKPDITKSK